MRSPLYSSVKFYDKFIGIKAHECDGLEHLLRYCGCLALALKRLREIDSQHLVYDNVKPRPGRGSEKCANSG
jgi:hypothetical protein